MQITTQQFQELVAQQNYQQEMNTLKLTRRLAKSKLTAITQQLCQQFQAAVDAGYLVDAQVEISGLPCPVTASLQTGIINLPLQDSAKLSHFFAAEEKQTVTANLVVVSEAINASGLRIDQVIADASQIMTAQATVQDLLTTNLQQIIDHCDHPAKSATNEA